MTMPALLHDDRHVPVVIGVGQINDRPPTDAEGLDSFGLMAAALERADADAGGGWLARLDSLAVVNQISFPDLGDLSLALAAHFGIAPLHLEQTPLPTGESPILLMHEAANRIGAGQIAVAAVVGGEALRTAARRAMGGPGKPNATAEMSARSAPPLRAKYGLVAPVDVYPLYENACRAAWGQSLAEAQAETGEIWSLFSQVAAANEGAWLRRPRHPDEIVTPCADNRSIAFPYTKLMVANSSVNQGAAVIMCSLAAARAAGIAEDRLVYVGLGAAAHEAEDPLARDRYDSSASMTVTLRRALELNALAAEDLDHVELYSCFPCVPKMARRVIGWDADRPATVFGGLTFGGGPIGNYMTHAVVAMVDRLRKAGRNGLLFANGGFATHNHALVVTRNPVPPGAFPQDFCCQQEADAVRNRVPELIEHYAGPATIETYTVVYDRTGSARFGAILARTTDGRRLLARISGEDAEGIDFLTSGAIEPVGTAGSVVIMNGYNMWTRSGINP